MPTGHTAGVADGTITAFRDFALRCARAIGYLAVMREDPPDAPIPEFTPNDYCAKAAARARDTLARLEAMTPAAIEAAAAAEHARRMVEFDTVRRRGSEVRARYERMLASAKAWVPPSPEYVSLHDYMIQQLEESIRFDCDLDYPEPTRTPPGDWHVVAVAKAREDITYHEGEQAKENERTAKRNAWVRALRESLR